MKKTGHPEYVRARVVCSCGETFETRATQPEIRIEICSKCHPFYLGTGRQRLVDTGGRVERFQKKYGEYRPRGAKKAEAAEAPEETEVAEGAETSLATASEEAGAVKAPEEAIAAEQAKVTADEAAAEEASEAAEEAVAEETVEV